MATFQCKFINLSRKSHTIFPYYEFKFYINFIVSSTNQKLDTPRLIRTVQDKYQL